MKTLQLTILALFTTLLISCGGGVTKAPANAEGFEVIEKEIKSKFGDDAYYTDLTIAYVDPIGNIISTTVTTDPESLEMGEWNNSQDSWQQTAEISLEISEGSTAKEFMFQLNDEINLKELGQLVEKSKEQLTKEKEIKNPKLSLAYISYPDNGDIADAKYVVTLEPENGGTSFSFFYNIDGDFLEMNY